MEEVPPPAFSPASVPSAVAKVKNLLTGQAATAREVESVAADPRALRDLIDTWMATPEFRDKMLGFFMNAFQQNQITAADLVDQLPTGLRGNSTTVARLMVNLRESFPRTVWQLVSEGRPLTEAISTRRFMMTPPLAALYAYLDNRHINDRGGVLDRTLQLDPQFTFRLTWSGGPIPLSETLNPSHANYMKWFVPTPPPAMHAPPCQEDPRVFTRTTAQLLSYLFGLVENSGQCQQSYTTTAQFADTEFDAWRMVRIRRPGPGEQPTRFYDLDALRKANELVLRVPRVGFFTTPAFFANWPTNSSNQARVTMNQTLIVALGKSFDDTNNTVPITETALDGEHAGPGTSCYGCHRTLDPMRQTFRQAFTLFYHEQLDVTQNLVPGVFAFGGVSKPLADIYDLAETLAAHPRFAVAWTQKLCQWANSAPCLEDDPEFLRVAEAFSQSKYDFKTLVRELFSSPLITGLAPTKTAEAGGIGVSIARREQLCASLSNRLGLPDVCGIGPALTLTPNQQRARVLASVIPADGYSRGAEAATVSTDPNLFFRASTENLCRIIADQVINAGTPPRYTSSRPQEAIADFVQTVMGLTPRDERAAPARQILTEHFDEAVRSGRTAADALKSTFILACLAPSSIASGL
ncbi:MAG: hypothetical protein RMK29_01705 [Myxococcales bacterium]|nr:hypothetical protein [Myxococcales bacterium]